MLVAVASVVFVFYGATRGVTEGQARYLADELDGRYAASPVALRLAKRIREEAGAGLQRPSQDVDLADMDRYELLRTLDQADLEKEVDEQLRALRLMLQAERLPGEPGPPGDATQ
jgi:hypothetical protein